MAERILGLARERDRIHLSNEDAIDFLKARLPRGRKRERVFVYLDPPYVNKAKRLYLNSFEQRDHARVAKYLQAQSALPWVMSYDDATLIRELYSAEKLASLPIRYSLQEKRSTTELIITPHRIRLPRKVVMQGDKAIPSVAE